jgi:hypothetical protein
MQYSSSAGRGGLPSQAGRGSCVLVGSAMCRSQTAAAKALAAAGEPRGVQAARAAAAPAEQVAAVKGRTKAAAVAADRTAAEARAAAGPLTAAARGVAAAEAPGAEVVAAAAGGCQSKPARVAARPAAAAVAAAAQVKVNQWAMPALMMEAVAPVATVTVPGWASSAEAANMAASDQQAAVLAAALAQMMAVVQAQPVQHFWALTISARWGCGAIQGWPPPWLVRIPSCRQANAADKLLLQTT